VQKLTAVSVQRKGGGAPLIFSQSVTTYPTLRNVASHADLHILTLSNLIPISTQHVKTLKHACYKTTQNHRD
jgi:hypothetical protein